MKAGDATQQTLLPIKSKLSKRSALNQPTAAVIVALQSNSKVQLRAVIDKR